MVEIRVAVADITQAYVLMRCLVGLPDLSSVRFDRRHKQVCARSEHESSAIVQVIDTVAIWLAADGIESARLSIGDRFHTLIGPACLTARNGMAAA